MSIFLTKLKSGNDLPFFPELVTLKEKKFSHSFLLISIRNTALNREQSETHFQEVTCTLIGLSLMSMIDSEKGLY
jgi:hypothetical protein